MSNEAIEPIEQNYVPYEELFPTVVLGGVEVKDDLTDLNNTWSSQKISNEFSDLRSSIGSDISDIESGLNSLDGRLDTAESSISTLQSNVSTNTTNISTLQSTVSTNTSNITNNTNAIALKANTSDVNTALGLKQSTSEKNSANGYMGLDSKKGLNTLENINLYNKLGGYNDLYQMSITASGASFSTNTGLKFSNSTMYLRSSKVITLTASSLASGTSSTNGAIYGFTSIDNRSLLNGIGLAIINNSGSTKSHSWYFAVSGVITINTSDTLSGNGLFIKYNPTLNSGNFQYGYVLSSVTTVTNSLTPILFNTLIKFKITYDKSTNNISYYINDTLLGTLNANITLGLTNSIFMFSCTDATDTNTERKMQPISLLLEGEYI